VPEIAALLRDRPNDPQSVFETCIRLGIHLNRRVLEHATRVVVHSRWNLAQLHAESPEAACRAVVIPHGAYPQSLTSAQRQAVRARFGIAQDAFVCASFGSLHRTKMNVEALAAFAPLARVRPNALFVFVGADMTGGEARAKVLELGLSGQVRFLGHQPNFEQFRNLCGAVDIAFNLRRPPTNGETSGSMLLLLSAGVPTVATDVDSMSSYPNDVVVKIPWSENVVDHLKARLARLAGDTRMRDKLGTAAQQYVREHHHWSQVAGRYAALIDEVSEQRAARTRSGVLQPRLTSTASGSSRDELAGHRSDRDEPRAIGPLRIVIPASADEHARAMPNELPLRSRTLFEPREENP
jgi:glycosyltransferase involved in cell wall biosynthesis